MLAYVATVSHPELVGQTYRMLVYSAGSKREVENEVRLEGWTVHKVSAASMEDITELPPKDELLATVRNEVARARLAQVHPALAAADVRFVDDQLPSRAGKRRWYVDHRTPTSCAESPAS